MHHLASVLNMNEKNEVEISKHTFPSHPRYAKFSRLYAFKLASDMGFPLSIAGNIQVATSEALCNVIHHAYKNRYDLPIHLEFHRHSHKLEIHVRDYGIRVPRAEIKSQGLDEIQEDGLGLYIMTKFMDYITFDTSVRTRYLANHGEKALIFK